MNILVTGANGQLGRSLKDVVKHYNVGKHNFIFASHDEVDITDVNKLGKFVDEHGIKMVVNCAAYTDVEKAEEDTAEAFRVNAWGASCLACVMERVNGFLIHISTDYVYAPYDGWDGSPFKVEDAEKCKPINMYGLSKRLGELAIKEWNCRHLIIRTSWLHSEYGNNFVTKLYSKIMSGNLLRFVYDEIGSPTSAASLALFIHEFIDRYNGEFFYETINYCDSGCASRYDMARAIAEKLDMRASILPCHSSDLSLKFKAKRPHYSVMDDRLPNNLKMMQDVYRHDWKYMLELTVDKIIELHRDPEDTCAKE